MAIAGGGGAVVGLPPRYAVERVLGQGGMATVYLARDTATETVVALKVLHPELRPSDAIVTRFCKELGVARRIRHPAVIATHDLVRTDDCVCLVMEYFEGTDLKLRLRRHARVLGNALRLLRGPSPDGPVGRGAVARSQRSGGVRPGVVYGARSSGVLDSQRR